MDDLPDMVYSSESVEEKAIKIDIDSMMNLLKTKISSLKLNDVPTLYVEKKMYSDLENSIKEQIPIFEEIGIEINYNELLDFQIKQYIFENYSKDIFRIYDDLYRLYMYVFDPYGEEYAKIFSQVFGQDMIYSKSNDRKVKEIYIEYLKSKYFENPDYFNTHIQKYFKQSGETGFNYLPDGSNKRTMRDVAGSENIRCPENNVKIVHGHGSIIPGEVFRIPSGAKVITLSQTNVCIPAMNTVEDLKDVFVPFMKLYMDGNTIFENDDSVRKLDSNFETLIDRYKNLGSKFTTTSGAENYLNFQYGLHLPGDIISDMLIQTEGSGCDNLLIGNDGCNILCFEKGSKKENNNYLNYIKFVANGDGTYEYGPDKRVTKMSNVLEEMGNGTYIIYSCRYSEEQSYELSRSLSNTVRLPGYDTSLKGPIMDDGLFMLSTRNQPEDIDEKKIYRYHIEFLEDYVDLSKHIEELERENKKLKQDNQELDEYAKRMYAINYQKRGGGQRKSRRKSRRKSKKK